MLIVLSQHIVYESDYEDIPFSIYHFPKRYRNQIHPGDCFIYYQGDRHKKDNRYYFGCGVIGDVFPDAAGDFYYAKILAGKPFKKNIPIYSPGGGFWESIDYKEVRNKPNPSWQNSIRKISQAAFREILHSADMEETSLSFSSQLEISSSSIEILKQLNTKYQGLAPKERVRNISAHLDRGSSVTKALKNILGAECQICSWKGFAKPDDQNYIEAHHLSQVSERSSDSLCTENIILVCPNCHSEIHYGSDVKVMNDKDYIIVKLSNQEARIHRNHISYLEKLSNSKKQL